MAASRYRIVLRGRLSERFESAFDGMTLEHGPNRTVLTGDVRDQAQLYGLIGRLQEFGIELLAVEPADAPEDGSESGAGPPASGLSVRSAGPGEGARIKTLVTTAVRTHDNEPGRGRLSGTRNFPLGRKRVPETGAIFRSG